MTADRWLRLSRGLGGLLALLALLVGVPVGLAALAGWPLPHGLPTPGTAKRALSDGWRPDDTIVLKAVAVVCWAAWAELVACAVVEVRATVQGRRQAPRVPLAGPLQTLVATLVATVVLATTPTTPQGGPARPPLSSLVGSRLQPPPRLHVATETAPAKAQVKAEPRLPPPMSDNRSPAPKQVVVRPRDNLWCLAQRHLGDPLRWREIWEHNRDRAQPDGRRLVHPHLIRPGWVLVLPADAVGVQPLPTTRVAPPAPPPPQPPGSSRGGPESSETPPPSPNGRGDRATPPASSAPGRQESPSDQRGPQPPTHRRGPVPPPVSVDLPSGSVVAASFAAGVASAVALGRLRRRRRYRPSPPRPALPRPSDVGTTTQRLIRAAGTAERPQGDGSRPASQPDETEFAFSGLDDPAPAGIAVGERSGQPVEVDLVGLGGLVLSGPGAPDVVRALVAALLAKGGPLVNQVIVPQATAARILPRLGTIPGLRVVADLSTALTEAEVEMLSRSRLLEGEDTPDFQTHRVRFPDDPLPAVVLIVDDERDHQGRLDAIAGLGGRLGVGVVVLGADVELPAHVEVGVNGHVARASPESLAASLTAATLYRLQEEEGVEVARVLAAAREDPIDVVERADEDVTLEVAAQSPSRQRQRCFLPLAPRSACSSWAPTASRSTVPSCAQG